jgi:hypothetical protein
MNSYHITFLPHENRWADRWTSLGGDFASAPTATRSRNGKIYVFCRGYDKILYTRLDEKEWRSLGYMD